MGFLEKLKNTFFEEEYVEIEEKPKVYKEINKERNVAEVKRSEERVRHVKVDKEEDVVHEGLPEKNRTMIEKRNIVEREKEEVQAEIKQKKTDFNYFDDADFLDFSDEEYVPKQKVEVVSKPVEVKPVEKPKLYDNPAYASKTTTTPAKSAPYSKQMKTGFQPTPIISPIYGILDKNYTKEEIVDKKEVRPSSYVSRKNADLDSIREKAFGSLTGDFNLTESQKEEVVEPVSPVMDIEEEFDDNLLYDMTNDSKTPTVDKVTLQDAEEYFQDLGLEYNIDYKDAKLERATGRRVSKTPKIDEIEEDEVTEEVEEVKVSKKLDDFEESSSLEDNLFDLIDSMYEEKE